MANYKKLLLIGCSAIVIQAISSLANASMSETVMVELDKDKDGLISLREATKNVKLLERFSKIDKNGDGFISLIELTSSKTEKS